MKTYLEIEYLAKIIQCTTNIIEKLKSAGSLWETNFILGFRKELLIQSVYVAITIEINPYDFIEKAFKSVENKYGNLDKNMQHQSGLDYANKGTIKCIAGNEPKGSSYVKSLG